jgi:hypothetical protein
MYSVSSVRTLVTVLVYFSVPFFSKYFVSSSYVRLKLSSLNFGAVYESISCFLNFVSKLHLYRNVLIDLCRHHTVSYSGVHPHVINNINVVVLQNF